MGAVETKPGAIASQVFFVGAGRAQLGSVAEMGFKAFNLGRMAAIGLNVPHAFVLPTGVCRSFPAAGGVLPEEIRGQLRAAIRQLELSTGLAFGGERRPLLVSVRSGAPVSMPGMMDTVLNVGLNEDTLAGLLRLTGNPRLVWDSYRRLVQAYAAVVGGCDPAPFAEETARVLRVERAERLSDLDFRGLRSLAQGFLEIYRELTGMRFPRSPVEQLETAVEAVFRSWWSRRAVEYRRLNGIDEALGTAVTVQRMVFGNAGGTSGAGVAFTRDPATGENRLYLDFAFNAQGEDVVSGREALESPERLVECMPGLLPQLADIRGRLEREFRDAQEIEFTVQDGELFMLQTRTGKRSPLAALRMAVEQVEEALIDRSQALARLSGIDLDAIRTAEVVPGPGCERLATGQGASTGVARGRLALDCDAAARMVSRGHKAILVRREVSTEDIGGIAVVAGLLTALGGRTSHAAVVARHLGKVCVVGCPALAIDLDARRMVLGNRSLGEGEILSINGASGEVFLGELEIHEEKPLALLEQVRRWRDEPAPPSAA